MIIDANKIYKFANRLRYTPPIEVNNELIDAYDYYKADLKNYIGKDVVE